MLNLERQGEANPSHPRQVRELSRGNSKRALFNQCSEKIYSRSYVLEQVAPKPPASRSQKSRT